MSNLCGHRGFAGPSACILKRGHGGAHSYGNWNDALIREEREELESLRQQLASCQAALADTEALEIGTGERLAKVEQQLAAANVLIAEQNKLGKERQEWALHTSDVIRSLNQQLAEALEQNLVLSKQTDHTILDLSNYVDSLEQQLAAALAAYKLKDDAVQHLIDEAKLTSSQYEVCRQSLAIQPDDAALKDEWRFK